MKERLGVVENELKHIRKDIQELKDEFEIFKKEVNGRFDELNKTLDTMTETIRTFGKLNGKDKATIIVALITALGALAISVVK